MQLPFRVTDIAGADLIVTKYDEHGKAVIKVIGQDVALKEDEMGELAIWLIQEKAYFTKGEKAVSY